jgi:tripartite-type tricarboxylate transporter receptor subunit TctC
MSRSMSRRYCLALFGVGTASPLAWAQPSWPAAKPVAVTVGLQAGTGSDVAMRNLAERVSVALGQQLVVNNLPGAAGLLAAQLGSKAPADGYSLVALSGAAVTTLPHMQKGQNPARDLVPIAMIVSFPSVISVNAKVPAQNIREFIELARKNPGKYTYASGGNGSVQHTAMEQLKAMAGMNLLHVPYKGMGQATTDLVGGQVDCAIQGVVAVIPFAKAGQVRVLAWTGARRNPLFPDIPTLHEAGVTGYQFQSWTALFGPAGLPREVVNRLNAEFRKAAAAPDLRER